MLVYLEHGPEDLHGRSAVGRVRLRRELDPGQVTLYKWNGTDFRAAPSQASVTFGYDASGATIRASARDLGNTKAFGFSVDAASGLVLDASGNPDFSNVHDDLAPDPGHGVFTFNVLPS